MINEYKDEFQHGYEWMINEYKDEFQHEYERMINWSLR